MYLDPSKLSAKLKRTEMTLPQLAKASGLNNRTVYDLFDRPHLCNPTLKTLNALADALGCKVTQLVSE